MNIVEKNDHDYLGYCQRISLDEYPVLWRVVDLATTGGGAVGPRQQGIHFLVKSKNQPLPLVEQSCQSLPQALCEVQDEFSGQVLLGRALFASGPAGVHLSFQGIAGPGVAGQPHLHHVFGRLARGATT